MANFLIILLYHKGQDDQPCQSRTVQLLYEWKVEFKAGLNCSEANWLDGKSIFNLECGSHKSINIDIV